ncbi:MAG: hypothetical protein LBS52_10220 [Dysgonamonadaceae bacterium]|jgi:hypothetical protein|nr:hypothetical protein [Dysgonamonadaceae bacterium]
MKKIKSYMLIAGIVLSASHLFAQKQDSLLRRQMELEREFNPTLQDANKINSLPALQQPTIKKADTHYSTWAGRTTPPLEIAMPKPGNAMTEIPYDDKRGYAGVGVGNNGNIDGIFGYRLIDKTADKLNFTFRHNSSNSNMEYVQDSDPFTNKAYFMDNTGRLEYDRLADAYRFNIGASYLHSSFNYYGNTFGDTRIFDDENQGLGVFSLNAGVQSVGNEDFNYTAFIDYKNFSNKYGTALNDKGLGGNQFDARFSLEKPFKDYDSRIGIDGQVFGVFNDVPSAIAYNDIFLLKGSPYFHFKGDAWDAKLGANVIFKFADQNRIYFTPNVNVSLNVSERSSLYATIGGGVDDNGHPNLMEESRYLKPMTYVKPSFSIIDMELGAKIGEADGFRFDIFGGFKKTSDEHFLLFEQTSSTPPTSSANKEYLNPFYADLSRSFIGGRVQNNSLSFLELSVGLKKNLYTLKGLTIGDTEVSDAKAYNRPGFEADIRTTFEVAADLKFTLNYYFAGDRWTYFNRENVKMGSISDLNLGAVYRFTDWLSINVKANNLLFQKYDIWYGFPAQGFNAMGGATIKF